MWGLCLVNNYRSSCEVDASKVDVRGRSEGTWIRDAQGGRRRFRRSASATGRRTVTFVTACWLRVRVRQSSQGWCGSRLGRRRSYRRSDVARCRRRLSLAGPEIRLGHQTVSERVCRRLSVQSAKTVDACCWPRRWTVSGSGSDVVSHVPRTPSVVVGRCPPTAAAAYHVVAMVAVDDVIRPSRGTSGRQWRKSRAGESVRRQRQQRRRRRPGN